MTNQGYKAKPRWKWYTDKCYPIYQRLAFHILLGFLPIFLHEVKRQSVVLPKSCFFVYEGLRVEFLVFYWLQIYFIIQLAQMASITHICLYFSEMSSFLDIRQEG